MPSAPVAVNDAPCQFDRWRAALEPGYVKSDGRSLPVLLRFAVRYAQLIRFYDLNDSSDGDWVEFFRSDPTMLLACLLGLDTESAAARFAELEASLQTTFGADADSEAEAEDPAVATRHSTALQPMFATILALAHNLDALATSGDMQPRTKSGRLLNTQLTYLIRGRLAAPLRSLRSYAAETGSSGALGQPPAQETLNFGSLSPLWEMARAEPAPRALAGKTTAAKALNAAAQMRSVLREFVEGIVQLQAEAFTLFEQSLDESGHRPQIGLYIAFAQLFQTAQATLNTLNTRYLDFYYHDVLHEGAAGATPDSVYLAFSAGPGAALPASVPQGSRFSAGQDANGNDIVYEADRAIDVSAVTLAQWRTLRCVHGPLLTPPAADAGTDCMQQVLAQQVPLPTTEVWPTFGASTTDAPGTAPATLGFAITSPYLLLTSGIRTITLAFAFTPESLLIVDTRLEAIEQRCGMKPADVLKAVLEHCFEIYISTAVGWLHIEHYEIAPNTDYAKHPFHLDLSFEVNAKVASFTGYVPDPEAKLDAALVSVDPAVNATNPLPGMPTVKVYVRQAEINLPSDNLAVRVYPLSLLGPLQVDRVGVSVDVRNMLGALQNSFGPLDTGAAFPIFGTATATGGYVEVAEPELFAKILEPDSLSATIEWAGLPPQETGFKGYYKDYLIGLDGKPQPGLFDNQTFGAKITVNNPGLWDLVDRWPQGVSPPPANSSVYLFRSLPDCVDPAPLKDGALCSLTTFNTFTVKANTDVPRYYDPAQSALRLTFTTPPYGFGEELYAINVLRSVVAGMPAPLGGPASTPVPVCSPLFDASQQVMQALEDCAGLPAAQWYDALALALDIAMERLVLAFLGAFLQSLSQCPDLPAPYTLEAVQKIADARIGLLPGAQARLLSDTLGKTGGLLNGCARIAFDDTAVLLQAAIAIETALTACPPPHDRPCVTAAVSAAALQVEQDYLACVKQQVLTYPNTPWVPMASALRISYRASCSFAVGSVEGDGQFFHLLPFDGLSNTVDAAMAPLVPCPTSDGALLLGLSGPPSAAALHLLFQLQANGIAGLPGVEWQYLTRTGWQAYTPQQIPSDTTNGLRNTGIATLVTPAFDLGNPAIQPDTCAWLRASVPRAAGSFGGTLGIFLHSLPATRSSAAGAGTQPLPAFTIESPVDALAGIASVLQPLPSFGGVPAEDEHAFYIRLGERLRHKDRAVVTWDYERLVLQAFPSIWKVKALPHTPVPGSVMVAVIAGPNGSASVMDPRTPQVTSEVLGAIHDFLAERAAVFATVEAVNPQFVEVQVHATVQLRSTDAPGSLLDRLNGELIAYLSPWFYDDDRAALGGRYAEPDAIATFIANRPYVVRLLSFDCGYSPPQPSEPCYLLTSAPSHRLTPS